MVRWEPGARDRLRTAAVELYLADGFEQTSVADIAAAAGLTERTFFRYFSDKREVLFDGQEQFQRIFLDGLEQAPDDAAPLPRVAAAMDLAARTFFEQSRLGWSRRRWQVIRSHPGLQERELLKLTGLSSALAAALRDRGVPEPQASLAAQSGVTVFKVAFDRWLEEGDRRGLADLQREVLAELGAVAATLGPAPAAP